MRVLLLMMMACVEQEPVRPPGDEIGLDLAASERARVVWGEQAAGHVDVLGELENSGLEVAVDPVVALPGGRIVSMDSLVYIALRDGRYFEVRALLELSQDEICDLEGQPLELTVTVTDLADDREVTEVTEVTAELDETALAYCP